MGGRFAAAGAAFVEEGRRIVRRRRRRRKGEGAALSRAGEPGPCDDPAAVDEVAGVEDDADVGDDDVVRGGPAAVDRAGGHHAVEAEEAETREDVAGGHRHTANGGTRQVEVVAIEATGPGTRRERGEDPVVEDVLAIGSGAQEGVDVEGAPAAHEAEEPFQEAEAVFGFVERFPVREAQHRGRELRDVAIQAQDALLFFGEGVVRVQDSVRRLEQRVDGVRGVLQDRAEATQRRERRPGVAVFFFFADEEVLLRRRRECVLDGTCHAQDSARRRSHE
mmetsp:Transcript_15864/g.47973  ORF Transcript_15864/g.47973 Transcript_15864/m.47973 type:complete len:278 (-) Transcript_15864:695-1528(-)